VDFECVRRASLDLRNVLGLLSEALSCAGRALDAKSSLRDPPPNHLLILKKLHLGFQRKQITQPKKLLFLTRTAHSHANQKVLLLLIKK
jgi:hypothetical protein